MQKSTEGRKANQGLMLSARVSLREEVGLTVAVTVLRCNFSAPSFQVLLTLDDDLDVVRRDQIPVF